MDEKLKAKVEALDAEDRHTLARVGRVVATDHGCSQQAAREHVCQHPAELRALGEACLRLAGSLSGRPVPDATDSDEPDTPAEV